MSSNILPRESFVVANGLRHHVLAWGREGASETVILCHGFLDIAWSWDAVAERLNESRFGIVAFDWRGHGDSEWVGKGGYYHFSDYVLDLDELWPKLATGPVHLVGHSMGGIACAMFAATHPDRLSTVTLIEGLGPAAGDPGAGRMEAPQRLVAWLRSVKRFRTHEPSTIDSVEEAIERMRVRNPSLSSDLGKFLCSKALRAREDNSGFEWKFDPLHLTKSPVAFRMEIFAEFLRQIDVPTLVIVGKKSSRDDLDRTRSVHLSNRTIHEIDDAGHMVHWDAPIALANAIAGFTKTPSHRVPERGPR